MVDERIVCKNETQNSYGARIEIEIVVVAKQSVSCGKGISGVINSDTDIKKENNC